MSQRLPIPGQDDGNWGVILNSFLEVSHNSDGSLVPSAVSTAGAVTTSQLGIPGGVATLDNRSTLTSTQLPGTVVNDNRVIAKGDLLVANSATALTRLGVGSDGQILTADSSQILGQRWVTPSSPPVSNVFNRTGSVTAQTGDYTVDQVTGAAPLASPALSGSPTAPSVTFSDSSTAIATTAFVNSVAPFTSKGVFNVMHPKYGAKGDGSTDDTVAINNAITDYNNNGGGVLFFPRGSSYYLTQGGHNISAPGIIAGQGYGTIAVGTNGTSVLYLKSSSNTNMFNLATKSISIIDIGLYGNTGNQSSTSYGIFLSSTIACNYFRFERVWIDSFHDDGIFLQGPGTSLSGIMHGVQVTNCGAHGIRFNAGSAADCQLTDCIVSANVLSGFYVNATDIVLTNCHAWGNGSSTSPPTAGDVSGLFMQSGAGGYLRVTGGYYETNGNPTAGGRGLSLRGRGNIVSGAVIYLNRAQGIYAYSNINSVITGCVIRGNNQNGGSGSGGAGILFDACTTCSIVACQMYDDTSVVVQTYGYAENGNNCNACLFNGNVSRAADHKTGNWLIGTGNPTATIPAAPASYNVG